MEDALKFIQNIVLSIYNLILLDSTSTNHKSVVNYKAKIDSNFIKCGISHGVNGEKYRVKDAMHLEDLIDPPPGDSGVKPPTIFQIKKYRYGTRADGSDRILYRFYIGTRHGKSGEGDIYAELYYGELLEGEWKIITIENVNQYERQPYFEHWQGEFIDLESLELLEVRKFQAPLGTRHLAEYNSE